MTELGATVYAISRSLKPLEELKKSHPNVFILQLDLSDWSKTRTELAKVIKDIKIDGLVNNAGVGASKSVFDLTEEDFDRLVFLLPSITLKFVISCVNNLISDIFFSFRLHFSIININLKAVFNVTQILLPNFNAGSSIVNISSLTGLRAIANHAIYSASKAGVDALTRAFALELGSKNIRVNSVNPTVVLTEMSTKYWTQPERGDPLKARIPLNRFCELNEVTDAIVYLLSDKSSFITGHSLPLEGGYCSA